MSRLHCFGVSVSNGYSNRKVEKKGVGGFLKHPRGLYLKRFHEQNPFFLKNKRKKKKRIKEQVFV